MKSSSDLIAVENKHLVLYAWEMNLKLTATAAIGVVILSMASNPSLERRSFVWPGSGSTIGNLYVPNQRHASVPKLCAKRENKPSEEASNRQSNDRNECMIRI